MPNHPAAVRAVKAWGIFNCKFPGQGSDKTLIDIIAREYTPLVEAVCSYLVEFDQIHPDRSVDTAALTDIRVALLKEVAGE